MVAGRESAVAVPLALYRCDGDVEHYVVTNPRAGIVVGERRGDASIYLLKVVM